MHFKSPTASRLMDFVVLLRARVHIKCCAAVRAANVYSRISFSSFFFTPSLFLFFPPYPQQMSVTSTSRRTPAHAIQVHHYFYLCFCMCVRARVSISCSSTVAFFNQHRCLFFSYRIGSIGLRWYCVYYFTSYWEKSNLYLSFRSSFFCLHGI